MSYAKPWKSYADQLNQLIDRGMVVTFTDISELKQVEAELRLARDGVKLPVSNWKPGGVFRSVAYGISRLYSEAATRAAAYAAGKIQPDLVPVATRHAEKGWGLATTDEPPRGRILIVEDHFPVALDIQKTLRDAGYRVVGPAGSQSEVIRLVRRGALDAALIDADSRQSAPLAVADWLAAAGVPFAFLVTDTSGLPRRQTAGSGSGMLLRGSAAPRGARIPGRRDHYVDELEPRRACSKPCFTFERTSSHAR